MPDTIQYSFLITSLYHCTLNLCSQGGPVTAYHLVSPLNNTGKASPDLHSDSPEGCVR